VTRRHVWMEVEMCGEGWMTEETVLILIYTFVIFIPLAAISLVRRIYLPYPLSLSSLRLFSHFGAVFALILFRL
jgi:hypothetical protein